ncbi:MAG: ABC transporter ATP-binding protein [Streptococcaceae bacterium]|jgi:putative ABC transport system ATP-binding protein|nr:ABC transporter ATP-binding protein [Streptococcaceae bacterium]
MALLKVKQLQKTYVTKQNNYPVKALKEIDFVVEEGEFIAVMGESGSGKSTLLNLLATLDKPSSGEILLNNKPLSKIPEKKAARFRREHIGFVFQDFHLLDTLNVKDNIFLPLVLSGISYKEMEQELTYLVQKLKIEDLLEKFPYELSGGQKQRVAIMRALITRPEIILADEPTGALDSHNSKNLLNLFSEVNKQGQTVLMVTHSALAASNSNRVLFIKDGQIFHQLYREEKNNEEFLLEINKIMIVSAV